MISGLRLTLRRSWGHAWVMLTATTTALVAAVLLVSVTVLAPGIADSALQRTLDTADPDRTTLTAATGFDAQWPELDSRVREAAADRSYLTGMITATVMGTAFMTAGMDENDRLAVGSIGSVADHATLTEGRWPKPGATPAEAVVHADATSAMNTSIGEVIEIEPLTGDPAPIEVTVVGTFTPNDPDDRVWNGNGTGVHRAEDSDFTVVGPVLVDESDLASSLGDHHATATWYVPLALDTITRTNANWFADEVDVLASDLADLRIGEHGQQMFVSSRSGALIRTASDAAESAYSLMLVIVVMLLVLGVWALAFTARLVATRRGPATALLRARGAGEGRILRWSVTGAIVPAVAIGLAAPILAELALEPVREGGSAGDFVAGSALGTTGWLVSAAVAAVWLTMMVAADLRAGRSVSRVAAEAARPRRAVAQRAGLDFALLALGLLGLQQLRRPRNATPDIVLVVAPSLIVLAGTVILIRALPGLTGVVAGLASRRRGLAAVLATTETARRSVRYAAASVLVVLAITVSVFAAATQSTWNQYNADTVDLAAPSDVRVHASTEEDTVAVNGRVDSMEQQLTGLPGVESAMPVFTTSFVDDNVTVDLIGLDPTQPAAAMRWDEQLAGDDPDELLQLLTDPGVASDGLPILATPAFADRFGLSVGDETALDLSGPAPTTVRLVGLVDTVPGSDHAAAAMTDSTELGRRLHHYVPNEWWLNTSDDGRRAAAAAAAVDNVVSATTHADLAAEEADDPLSAGITAGLTAGLAFAAAIALIGIVVHTVTAFQSRSSEFAVIRAIGLDRRGIAGAAAVEQGVLLGFSTLAGIGLGLLVSWLVVPDAVGDLAGMPEVPPMRLQVPWEIVYGLSAAIVVLGAILLVIRTTMARHLDLAAVLRTGEDT